MKIQKRVVEYFIFFCPACKHEHTYTVESNGSQWQFNGDMSNPSFTPSLLNRTYDNEGNIKTSCHLFVTDGKIQYCSDCTHEFSSKIIDMVDKY